MYRNEAYDFDNNPNKEDLSVPLKINNCGHYIIKTFPVATTYVPNGRNDYQLIYIASGKAYFYFNGEEIIVPKGSIVLYRPGEPQIYDYYLEDKTDVFWIHFTGSKAEEYLKRYMSAQNNHISYVGTSSDYQWIFDQIIREIRLQRVNYEELVKNLFIQLLLIFDRYITEGNKVEYKIISEIEKAVHYFNNNFGKDISVEKYAREHFFSVNWFIKCFKIITSQTPMQYILSLRVSQAKGYLEKSDMSIMEIAASVGYENPTYFSRMFRKHTGMSPGEYRKLYS